jgi:hypothetical protein
VQHPGKHLVTRERDESPDGPSSWRCYATKGVRHSWVRRFVQFAPAAVPRSAPNESAYVIYTVATAIEPIYLSLVFVADVLWEQ